MNDVPIAIVMSRATFSCTGENSNEKKIIDLLYPLLPCDILFAFGEQGSRRLALKIFDKTWRKARTEFGLHKKRDDSE